MKPKLDKRLLYAGAILIFLVGTLGIIIALTQNNENTTTTNNTTEFSTDISSEITTEITSEVNSEATDYFFMRPEGQKRVLAIKELVESEIPVPYDFTQYGMKNYSDSRYYALVILAFAENQTDSAVSTESIIIEVARLEIISELEASHIEQVYNQMEIRYEEDYAIFQHDRKFLVTSLTEPKLYKSYALYDLKFISESTPDTTTIGVYQSSFANVMFSKSDKQFISGPVTGQTAEDYNWEDKTIIHKPALTSEQGPSLSKITAEPRLVSLSLGASSSVIFDRLGQPDNLGWLSGYYLAYEDLLFFSAMEENGDTLTFHPTETILYFGDYSVAGLKKGMTFKEVEEIIGPQDVLIFTEGNELNYPFSVVLKKEGFSISIGFNANFEITQFLIRPEDVETGPIGETLPNEIETAFSKEAFDVYGLEQITDFTSKFNVCYFNASTGFYTYDLSRQEPAFINEQPMYTVFEVLHDINPSIVTVGKEDGVIYIIDLNTFEATQVSGPNYKNHIAGDEMIIKASLLND